MSKGGTDSRSGEPSTRKPFQVTKRDFLTALGLAGGSVMLATSVEKVIKEINTSEPATPADVKEAAKVYLQALDAGNFDLSTTILLAANDKGIVGRVLDEAKRQRAEERTRAR